MRRFWLTLVATSLAALLSASPPPLPRNAPGVVKAADAGSLTITTHKGDRTFTLTPGTQYFRAPGESPAAFSDLQVGSRVVVSSLADKVTARRVLILRAAPPAGRTR